MKDIMSIILDCIFTFAYIGLRMAAITSGIIGIGTQKVEIMTTAILLYLLSNTLEEEVEERLKRMDKNENDTTNTGSN